MFPAAYPHQPIETLYPDVFILPGSIRMGPGLYMNRNMLILREGEQLTLINPVRMSDQGLVKLDTLGNVTNIIRLGDFHGLDDEFYMDRYEAQFWCQNGQATYLSPLPNVIIHKETPAPIANSQFFIFEQAKYPEAALLLKKHKLLVTTDGLQFYQDWHYFSFISKLVFKLMGFKLGMNIGGPWIKRVTPKNGSMQQDFQALMELDFDALVGAHGSCLTSGAKALIKDEMARTFKSEQPLQASSVS